MLLQEVGHCGHMLVTQAKMDMQVIFLIEWTGPGRESHCHLAEGKAAHPAVAQELLFRQVRRIRALGMRKVRG